MQFTQEPSLYQWHRLHLLMEKWQSGLRTVQPHGAAFPNEQVIQEIISSYLRAVRPLVVKWHSAAFPNEQVIQEIISSYLRAVRPLAA